MSILPAQEAFKVAGDKARGVVITQAVPFPFSATIPVVSQYQKLMKQYAPNEALSFTSLEGFIAAKITVEAIKRAGPSPTRDKVLKALNNMGSSTSAGSTSTTRPRAARAGAASTSPSSARTASCCASRGKPAPNPARVDEQSGLQRAQEVEDVLLGPLPELLKLLMTPFASEPLLECSRMRRARGPRCARRAGRRSAGRDPTAARCRNSLGTRLALALTPSASRRPMSCTRGRRTG
jgi:hypothetical protein